MRWFYHGKVIVFEESFDIEAFAIVFIIVGVIMETVSDWILSKSVCCSEKDCVVTKTNRAVEAEGLAEPSVCITQHPGFQEVCFNCWVLQMVWYQHKKQYHNFYEGPAHKRNRHIAYRQLQRWCWGILGKQIRVVIPPCAVCCICAHFPSPHNEDDLVFEAFQLPEEQSWQKLHILTFISLRGKNGAVGSCIMLILQKKILHYYLRLTLT